MMLAAALALAGTGDARAEEKPARLWMWGSVERPPPRWKYGERTFFHGDRQISLSEFVRIAGYPEMADRMERRTLTRRLVMVGGAAVLASGAILAGTAPSCEGAGVPDCSDRASRQRLGIGVAVSGMVIIAGAEFFLQSFRPAYHDLRKMETDYNKRLSVTPVVGLHGAGVQAQLSF